MVVPAEAHAPILLAHKQLQHLLCKAYTSGVQWLISSVVVVRRGRPPAAHKQMPRALPNVIRAVPPARRDGCPKRNLRAREKLRRVPLVGHEPTAQPIVHIRRARKARRGVHANILHIVQHHHNRQRIARRKPDALERVEQPERLLGA
jgi:hypothetical protein